MAIFNTKLLICVIAGLVAIAATLAEMKKTQAERDAALAQQLVQQQVTAPSGIDWKDIDARNKAMAKAQREGLITPTNTAKSLVTRCRNSPGKERTTPVNTTLKTFRNLLILLALGAPLTFGAGAGGYDFAGSITGAASGLVVNQEPMFKPIGDGIFASLTVVMLIVCGKRIIFSTSHAEYHAGLAYLKSFLGHWLVGWTCLAFYDVPLWGDMSIHQVIPMMASFLAGKINTAIVDTMMADMSTVIAGMPMPALFSPAELYTYAMVMLQSMVMEAVLVLASSFAFVALGVGTLFGPILISGIIVPWLRPWFFSWINFTLKFAMFAVAAAAQAFVWATAADNFILNFVKGNYTLAHLLTSLVGLGIITIGAVWGLLSTGHLVNDLFGGSAHGHGGIGVIGALKGLF